MRGSVQENGVEGVILVVIVVIQITGDPSAERMTPPRSTHVRLGRRLLLVDPARGRERLMEIQQHNGVVVEVEVISARLRQAQREGEVLRGEREAPGAWLRSPPSPSLYIGALWGGAVPRDPISRGGGGQGGNLPPKSGGAPPPLGFPTLGAGEAQGGRTSPPGADSLPHFSPWAPLG